MKTYVINRFNSKITVFEYDPKKNPSQIIYKKERREPMSNFTHSWFECCGYRIVAKFNLGFFETAKLNSTHIGMVAHDRGFFHGYPTLAWEMWLDRTGKLHIENLKNRSDIQGKEDWGITLSYPLVLNGKKDIRDTATFNTADKTNRTAYGQKADGTIVCLIADSLDADNTADVMIELGCIKAIMADGGGSSQAEIDGKVIRKTSRPLGTMLLVFAKENEKVEHVTYSVPSKKKILVEDIGHGGADPGAVAFGFPYREKDLTMMIGKKIYSHLTANYEVDIRMTRDTDKTMDLKNRVDFANSVNADYFFSVHVNAGGGTGYEDFIYINLLDSGSTAKLREIIHEEIALVLKKYNVRNRGKKKANFHVLRETNMPAMLSEYMFIDHPEDQKLLLNENFINDMAVASAEGIAKALALPAKATKIETPNEKLPEKTLYRIFVDGTQVGAWATMSYLLRNIEKAIEGGAKEIMVERV